uniref:Testis expressed 2 n=1 Tax=Tetraodon nigroviridis TaxID=99883 RepID=H3DKV5_TETNG
SGQHAEAPRQASGPRLQVQRSLSRDTITIHFSALGKEEEDEEEELYGLGRQGVDDPLTTGSEAREDLEFESSGLQASSDAVVSTLEESDVLQHAPSSARTISSPCGHSRLGSNPSTSSSWPSDRPLANPPGPGFSSSSPGRAGPPPSSKPFLSLVRSLSNDVESQAAQGPPAAAPLHVRHRHLMKTLVKSLSTDTEQQQAQQVQPPQRSSPRNMQLFKQFSQPRLASCPVPVTHAGGDSKTAPSSPIMSPDGRSFFKVQEVEARIEDTKRRLSEVMSDPLQLFSKIMGDESGAGAVGGAPHRAKLLSSSASELTGMTAVNGHAEGNSSYCILKAKGSDVMFFSLPSLAPAPALGQASSGSLPRSPSLTLGRCSMSALVARQEDEDFCQLYSQDFDLCAAAETPDEDCSASQRPYTGDTGTCGDLDTEEEKKMLERQSAPVTGLVFLTQLVYLYLACPVPPYVCALVHGIVAGFALALLLLWLSSPRRSSPGTRAWRRRAERWNVAHLDIKEPGIFKGWMNEIHSYDPEMYHATLTHSVYVRLEGSVLRLSKPNRNISRRAAHNEPKPDVNFVSQKIYDLTDSKIQLLPQSLARKRVWNKKYPICIELARQDDFMSKAQGEKSETGEDKPQGTGERPERSDTEGSAEEPRRRPSGGGDLTIYLFGRTGREKEEWFRRFLLASRLKSEGKGGSLAAISKSAFWPSHSGSTHSCGGLEADSRSSSRGSLEELSQSRSAGAAKQKAMLDYGVYMAKYVQPQAPLRSPTASEGARQSPESSPQSTQKMGQSSEEAVEPEAWVNAFLGRIFWDFLGEKYWANIISKKIQMKLSKIRLPYVMNELTLTELDMGFSIPKVLQASAPTVDHQGLWFDLEVCYTGSFLMTLETKLNLARLGKEGEGLREQGKEWSRPRTYCLADSDEESSSAGSSDEEDPPELLSDKSVLPGGEGYVGGHRPSKIMRFVDKIAKSKYFQKATETEFIKKKMEEVANTPLLLTVEVQECRGTLAVNIPPPHTDRIWYGFRSPPHLELKARPKLGEREVTLAHVTDWIERKLDQEFQKIFVMPNMDDVWLPIMHSAMDTRSNASLVAMTNDASKDPE